MIPEQANLLTLELKIKGDLWLLQLHLDCCSSNILNYRQVCYSNSLQNHLPSLPHNIKETLLPRPALNLGAGRKLWGAESCFMDSVPMNREGYVRSFISWWIFLFFSPLVPELKTTNGSMINKSSFYRKITHELTELICNRNQTQCGSSTVLKLTDSWSNLMQIISLTLSSMTKSPLRELDKASFYVSRIISDYTAHCSTVKRSTFHKFQQPRLWDLIVYSVKEYTATSNRRDTDR